MTCLRLYFYSICYLNLPPFTGSCLLQNFKDIRREYIAPGYCQVRGGICQIRLFHKMSYFDNLWLNILNGDNTQGRDLFWRRLKKRENGTAIAFMYLHHTW